ncbi:hypothetical protein WQ57_20250 [Mesobacillus campisalis]|uniref:Uncharacterized protein n=1 Tax=Mesobacillus campisalis TaxID=1408103 RepID=A0A0M2STA7_9BACI|nr:hypothetical protein WQ57_20250 [Mesobacillus campisalis]
MHFSSQSYLNIPNDLKNQEKMIKRVFEGFPPIGGVSFGSHREKGKRDTPGVFLRHAAEN